MCCCYLLQWKLRLKSGPVHEPLDSNGIGLLIGSYFEYVMNVTDYIFIWIWVWVCLKMEKQIQSNPIQKPSIFLCHFIFEMKVKANGDIEHSRNIFWMCVICGKIENWFALFCWFFLLLSKHQFKVQTEKDFKLDHSHKSKMV